MANSEVTIRKVVWSELFPWLILFRSVRIALMARVLVLGAIGLILTTLGWRVIAWMFINVGDSVVTSWKSDINDWLWNDSGFAIDLTARSTSDVAASAASDLYLVPAEAWLYITAPFRHMFDADLTASGFLCMLLACVWELLVWGVVGGAIARIAALKYTRDEAPTFFAALKHSVTKLPSYSFGPMVAVAGAAVFSLQLVVLGLIMNLDILAVVAALLWPFVLVLGLLMAILLLGALVGWPLMWATVAVEGTDAFDALSRSYAYTYQRPWRLLWYVTFSVFLAAVSMFVVKAFAISAVGLGDWSISWGLEKAEREAILGRSDKDDKNEETSKQVETGLTPPLRDDAETNQEIQTVAPTASDSGIDDANERKTQSETDETAPPRDDTSTKQAPQPVAATKDITNKAPSPAEQRWSITTANRLIHFWQSLWKSLAAGYQAAFIWVSAVGIYLLLRRDIDGAELDEVYLDHNDEHGIPALEEDPATGIPEVAPGRTAQPADAGEAAKARQE